MARTSPKATTPAENVGKRIRSLRRASGWTLEVLAERSGLHPNFLGLVERGTKNPSLDTIVLVARGLNVEPQSLFDGLEGMRAVELRALVRERVGLMSEEQLLRVVRILDAIR